MIELIRKEGLFRKDAQYLATFSLLASIVAAGCTYAFLGIETTWIQYILLISAILASLAILHEMVGFAVWWYKTAKDSPAYESRAVRLAFLAITPALLTTLLGVVTTWWLITVGTGLVQLAQNR